jgi:hypothetical protein
VADCRPLTPPRSQEEANQLIDELHRCLGEHVGINRIAAMSGVTRQRISALLKEPADAGANSEDAPLRP